MSNKEKIIEMLKENNGIITSKEVKKNKINKTYLSELVNEGLLTRVKRGLYVANDSWGDEYYNLTYNTKAIYSYETALYFLGLCESVPIKYNLTVPRGYNASLNNNDKVILHFVKKEIFEIGKELIRSPQGQYINCYNAERTICDLLKDKEQQDIETLKYAIKEYLSDKNNRDLPKLMEYAKELGVLEKLHNYLEVLM